MPHHAEAERHALAQTLRQAGPAAPTLCAGWTTTELAAHLVARERSVVEATGRIPVPALQRAAAGVVDRYAREHAYAWLTDAVDAGPRWGGRVSPTAWLWALPPVRETVNLLEYVIHHEDVRRAGPGWTPRELPGDAQQAVWSRLRLVAPVLLRRVPVGVRLEVPGGGSLVTRRARRGTAAVTVVGEPVELALAVYGRIAEARVRWHGDAADVDAVHGADLSF